MRESDESSSEEELFPIKLEEACTYGSVVLKPFDYLDPSSFSGMMKAVALNDVDEVLCKIRSGKSVREIDNAGNSLLHIAVRAPRRNDTRMIDLLLEQEEIDIDAVNFNGETPFTLCLLMDNSELAFHLIKAGASVNICGWGRTALHICCSLSLRDVAVYLIENGADINAFDLDNDTPLHIAVLSQQLEMVCLLLYYEADTSLQNVCESTPLNLSLGLYNPDITDILVDYATEPPCKLINIAVSHEYEDICYFIERIFMNMRSLESGNLLEYESWQFIIKQPALKDRFFKHFPLTFSFRDILFRFFMLSEEVDNIDQYAMAARDEDFSIGDDCEAYLITKLLTLLYIRSNRIELRIDRTEIDFIYVLLSYGLPVWDVDVDLVYELFGYCDLFKLLLHMDILPSRFVPFNIMSYIIFSTDDLFSLQKTVDELIPETRGILSYNESHLLRCHTKLAFRRVDDSIHKIPSLLDIARVEARNYICRRFRIKNSRQFYTLLHNAPVPNTVKKLLAFETPIYNKEDTFPEQTNFLTINPDLTRECVELRDYFE